MKSPPSPAPKISRIKGTPAAILGRIKAPDAEAAVKEWIEKFNITDPQQQRLSLLKTLNAGKTPGFLGFRSFE